MSGSSRVADCRAGTTTFLFGESRFDSIANAALYTSGGTLVLAGGDTTSSSGTLTMLQRAASESVTAQPGCRLPLDLAMLQRVVGSECVDTANRCAKGATMPATCTTTAAAGWVTIAGGTY